MKRVILQIVLICISAALAVAIWKTVMKPIDFKKEKDVRYEVVVQKLKDIRKAQVAFKSVNGKYTGSFDTLIDFIKNDSLPQIYKVGMLTDSMIDAGLNEKSALKKGLIIRDTIRVSVLTEVFDESYNADELRYIPFSGGEEYQLAQTIIKTGSGIKVPVFEAKAHNNKYMYELKETYGQEIINLSEKARTNGKYPGLKVGSVIEPNNNAGNWE